MSGARVRLRAVGKTYADGVVALHPIDLDVAAGETVVLLGPSGCGKTTTLRIAAGLLAPDLGGRVWYDDDDVTALPIERRDVGMVFQSYALFPHMSVARNVGYGLEVRGTNATERERRVSDVLALCRITELAARPVDRLSGGQRQRVALARALAPGPRVLYLDEPLAALDARLRETLREELDRTLRAVGTTAVYVTHDRAEAMALGDRIVVMDAGRIAQIGTPREVYERPATLGVARFVGTLNRLPARKGEAAAYVRPHDVRIVPLDGAPYAGRLVDARFLGDRTRLTIDGIDDEPWTVDCTDPVAVAPGERIGVAVRAGAAVRFA